MELESRTPFVTAVLRLERVEGVVESTVLVKATFGGSGQAIRVAAEQLPLVKDRLETPFGIFHSDGYAHKDGVDLCVLGTVRSSAPVRTAALELTLRSHRAELQVSGDRRWQRQDGRLVPSDPVPFVQMPLAYSRAYGGAAEYNYEQVRWPDNPIGCGYYLTPEQAEGAPLPNVELPTEAVARWDDQPTVAGWAPYPQFWGLRGREGVEINPQVTGASLPRLKARLNNHAHPTLIVPEVTPGDVVRIRGMRDHDLVVSLPRVAPLLRVSVGERVTEVVGKIDGVFLWVDAGMLTLTYRIPFQYHYVKGEPRKAWLTTVSPTAKE